MKPIFIAAASVAVLAAAAGPVWVGKFGDSGAPPAPWRVVQLDKKVKSTSYRLATVEGVLRLKRVLTTAWRFSRVRSRSTSR